MKQGIIFSLAAIFIFGTAGFSQLTPTLQDIWIPMSDGDSLMADVYIPSGVDSSEVIFIQTPYNKDAFNAGMPIGVGTNLNSQPYIWVIMDWRGFYGSSGADLSSVDRGQDAYDACDWIVAQTWHKDRIGTWGPSALGGIQYQLISKQHPNHTCAVPLVADAQQAYDAYFYGGVLEEARLNQLDALGYGLSPIILSNVYYSSLWAYTESTTYYAPYIQIPTLQIGGWYDHNINRMMDFYKGSRNDADVSVQDQQWLLVGPWVHGGTGSAYVGSSNQGQLNYPTAAFVSDVMAWDFLNYYLLDSVNNWQNTDLVTYFDMGGTDNWLTSNADDIAATGTNVLYLSAPGKLISSTGVSSTSFVSDPNNPSPTIGGATLKVGLDQGPYDQSALDPRSDIITFSTGDLTQDVTVTGRIQLDLYVSADQPDCDIAVRLVDKYPTGQNMLITDGIKRMRFRNGYTSADEVFMTPGTVYNVQVDLPFLRYTWKAGHEIKIYLGGNHSTRFNVNLQDGGTMYTAGTGNIANITIHHDATYPSRIILPGTNPSLGIVKNETASLSIYPNPATDYIHVNSAEKFLYAHIIDINGKVVLTSNYANDIDVRNLEKGIYFLRLTQENGQLLEGKFVKQ